MPRRVLLIAADLFFAARVRETAVQLDVSVEEASVESAMERMLAARPDLAIADLQGRGDVLGLVAAAHENPATQDIEWVGFYSHVDTATRENALAAGVDHVLPRSAFTRRLPDLLKSGVEPS